MKPKKNPKRDLNKNSGLYFVIGLMLVLCLTFIAFEWKSYDKPFYDDIGMNTLDNEITEELPPIILPKTPPPPPPITPTVIELAKDDDPIIETIIETSESSEETPIIEVSDVIYEEVQPEIDVDWISIEEVPVFPGCENEKDKRACFQKMMNKHIQKAIRYPEEAQEMGLEGKVFTQFTIQADGTIGEIRLRGPHKALEKESARIINRLPIMTPGKQRDRNVKVAFTIPINFRLQ
ncbi:energy transducer TonB [Maribacter sp. HTCC2170]|uniref:energy transducer TonB n=1 Tax=Maribacter sp. (strain HTCC2170 / KCCM 42371) TaxID=313603 RepID=UPI00006B1A70|nr:energy transducer TonB [Maribacter sp. HTCC2170]EAR00849.1 TonB [Maribacter sp. HTCC2170]